MHAERRRRFRQMRIRHPAVLVLDQLQRLEHRGTGAAMLVRGGADAGEKIGRKAHRSTSDMTKSMLAIWATRSATVMPGTIFGIIWRWAKEGVRIRVR